MKTRILAAALAALISAAAFGATGATGATGELDARMAARRGEVVGVVEKTSPAVVNISTEAVVQRGFFFDDSSPFNDPFFEQYMGQFSRPEIAHSLGSGGIFTPDGYIFTNAHVVNRASRIVVTLSDGTQYTAELVNVDLQTDLAVIKITAPTPLPVLVLGRSEDLMVGERAIAVGNPFGLSNTVTQGVISATHRDVVVDNEVVFKDFLQTDALINPGNSGGPLLNVFGEVIGVNSAMRANAQGIGFAIPVDRAKASLAALLDYRKLRRMRLGFNLDEKYTGAGPETYIVVSAVEPGGAAAGTGLKVGDVVTAAAGKPVSTLVGFRAAVLAAPEGAISITTRLTGALRNLQITPTVVPKPDGVKLAMSMMGLSVRPMDRSLGRQVGFDIDHGIFVADVAAGSAGARAGLRAGDVILQVNDALTADMEAFAAALDASAGAPGLQLVTVRRQGMVIYQRTLTVDMARPMI